MGPKISHNDKTKNSCFWWELNLGFIASSLQLSRYEGYVVLYPKNCIKIMFNLDKIEFRTTCLCL
jgi:hypothetical protein